jgi:uncharacterized protein (TIGR00369 family)
MPEVPDFPTDLADLVAWFERQGADGLPGLLGIEVVSIEPGRCTLRLDVSHRHLASNGYLHAATVVALADTAAGYGCVASLPDGAIGFTTTELKSNHTGTLTEGGIRATATLVNAGRTLQIWDATVTMEQTQKTIGLFRNTQLLLYP